MPRRTCLAAALSLFTLPVHAQVAGDGFWQSTEDGGARHLPSNGFCTPDVVGLTLTKTQSYDQNGRDGGCQYGLPGGDVISIYFTDFGGASFAAVAADAERAMVSRLKVSANPDIGAYCDTKLDEALQAQGARMGTGNTPESDCAIVANEKFSSLLMLERVGNWTIKVRISTRSVGSEALANVMQTGALILQIQREAIAGAPAAQ